MKIRLLVDLPISDEYKMLAGTELEVRETEIKGRNMPEWMYDHPDEVSIGIYRREAEIVDEDKT